VGSTAGCREAELLAEVGRLKEGQRTKAASEPPGEQQATAAAAAVQRQQVERHQQQEEEERHVHKLNRLHRDLFLAAAQHMLKEFSAKVAQVGWPERGLTHLGGLPALGRALCGTIFVEMFGKHTFAGGLL
jgi:hypothetical protein